MPPRLNKKMGLLPAAGAGEESKVLSPQRLFDDLKIINQS
jgi:hypothetical protein